MLKTVRAIRSERNIGATRKLKALVLDLSEADDVTRGTVEAITSSLQAVARCDEVRYGDASHETQIPGVRVDIES